MLFIIRKKEKPTIRYWIFSLSIFTLVFNKLLIKLYIIKKLKMIFCPKKNPLAFPYPIWRTPWSLNHISFIIKEVPKTMKIFIMPKKNKPFSNKLNPFFLKNNSSRNRKIAIKKSGANAQANLMKTIPIPGSVILAKNAKLTHPSIKTVIRKKRFAILVLNLE